MSDHEIQALRREPAGDATDEEARTRLVAAERRAGLHREPLADLAGALGRLLEGRRGFVLIAKDPRTVEFEAVLWSLRGVRPMVGHIVSRDDDGSVGSMIPGDREAVGVVRSVIRDRFPHVSNTQRYREGLEGALAHGRARFGTQLGLPHAAIFMGSME